MKRNHHQKQSVRCNQCRTETIPCHPLAATTTIKYHRFHTVTTTQDTKKEKKNRSPTQETMAKLSSWFAVLRWALILTLILVIILSIAPIIFPRHFEKSQKGTRDVQLINSALMVGLSVYGLLSVCCYYYYLTLIFGISLLVYLIVELVWLQLGNIGIYLTLAGLIICSFTYCAAMRRLRHEALYGP